MISITPFPAKCDVHEGSFLLSSETIIQADKAYLALVNYLNESLSIFLGYRLKTGSPEIALNIITFELDISLSRLGIEGYSLKITSREISIRSSTTQGIFYGIQSLLQLILPSRDKNRLELPQLSLEDYPRFSWRGFMLDVGRHYHPVETIKKLLQIMAILKMNRFHWHFNDDQGWRIEIKEYPKLTTIGSKRKDTQIGGYLSKKYRGITHEGFYTVEEVRDIIQFAQQRYIQVIPEIEIPGHCSAVIASHPELSCTGNKIDVKTKSGIYKDIYCPGKEHTFKILEKILMQLIDLFPSNMIHIGGDESPKERWKKCSDCQARIKKEGLKNEKDLYFYFVDRIINFLKSKDKTSIGWNQILKESLDESTIIQWWAGRKRNLYKGLKEGRKFILSKMTHSYLDYNYLMFPMRKFYDFEPIPKRLEQEYHKNILGIEAPLWTEWVPNLERLGWQVFPRIFASAEVGWIQRKLKNYHDFKERLPNLFEYLKILEMPFAKLEETDPRNFKRILQLYKWFKWPKI